MSFRWRTASFWTLADVACARPDFAASNSCIIATWECVYSAFRIESEWVNDGLRQMMAQVSQRGAARVSSSCRLQARLPPPPVKFTSHMAASMLRFFDEINMYVN